MLFAVRSRFDFRFSDVQTSSIIWGLYMTTLILYCIIYQKIVSAAPPDISGSFIWAVREWGIWLFLTPVAFRILRHYDNLNRIRFSLFLKLGAGILLVSLTFRAGIDYWSGTHGIAQSIVIFLPRHAAAFAVAILIWHLILRSKSTPGDAPAASDNGIAGNRNRYPKTLLVSKGNDECLIQVEHIKCVSAAGNYVEIDCNNQLYLMRATMKQIEKLLPPELFLRTHRSHIINIGEIDRIKTRPSGNGAVRLRCGKMLNISKKYKQQLQKYRPAAA